MQQHGGNFLMLQTCNINLCQRRGGGCGVRDFFFFFFFFFSKKKKKKKNTVDLTMANH